MTYENYIKAKMVDFAVAEAAHHGGADGMLAVAQVLANRVNAGWGEWHSVIAKAPECVGTLQPKVTLDPRDISFRRLLSQIDDIYHGTADDSNVNIEDDRGKSVALYYAELSSIENAWFIRNITSQIERHPMIAKVGPLTFFA